MIAAQDTVTANSADGMFILVLGMGYSAQRAGWLVTTGAAVTAALATTLACLGYGFRDSIKYGGHVVLTFWDRRSEFQAMGKLAFPGKTGMVAKASWETHRMGAA